MTSQTPTGDSSANRNALFQQNSLESPRARPPTLAMGFSPEKSFDIAKGWWVCCALRDTACRGKPLCLTTLHHAFVQRPP